MLQLLCISSSEFLILFWLQWLLQTFSIHLNYLCIWPSKPYSVVSLLIPHGNYIYMRNNMKKRETDDFLSSPPLYLESGMGLCHVGIKPAQELFYIFLVSALEVKTLKLDFVSLSQLSLSRRPQGNQFSIMALSWSIGTWNEVYFAELIKEELMRVFRLVGPGVYH